MNVGTQIFGKPDCQHGVAWDAECLKCKIVWYRECRDDAQRRVESCTKEIERLIVLSEKP